MELLPFDRSRGHRVDRFGSDFVLTPLARDGAVHVACLHLEPGEHVGEHEAAVAQLFCVVAGAGWVSGSDGRKVDIATDEAARWTAGEVHAAGTEVGLTAIVIEGLDG